MCYKFVVFFVNASWRTYFGLGVLLVKTFLSNHYYYYFFNLLVLSTLSNFIVLKATKAVCRGEKVNIFLLISDCDIILHWPAGLHILLCSRPLAVRQTFTFITELSSPRLVYFTSPQIFLEDKIFISFAYFVMFHYKILNHDVNLRSPQLNCQLGPLWSS